MPSRTEVLQHEYLRREGHDPQHFRYFTPDGKVFRKKTELTRIAALAVPPAYTEVYVSPDPQAELQAFGRDAAGRLQYRYHPDFVQQGATRKWRRLLRFAGILPTLRTVTASDLRRRNAGGEGLPERRVLALMTRLLHTLHLRVGSDRYAREHRTYGLSTLRQHHVQIAGHTLTLDFRGKHGIRQHLEASDATLSGNLERLLALPGPWLFQYEDGEGRRHRVTAPLLNGYIREVVGPFTAKDFRTWGGTLAAAEFLAGAGAAENEREAKRVLVACVKAVAADLGNTPAVVRGHYVCPVIFDRYLEGRLLDDYQPRGDRAAADDDGLTRGEAALKRMLESEKELRGGRRA